MTQNKRNKILVFPFQYTGHINPLSCILIELVKAQVHVICFGTDQIKSIIEKTGAEYKEYSTNSNRFRQSPTPTLARLAIDSVNDTTENIDRFAHIIQSERPDAIFYDEMAACAKFTMMLLRKRHEHNKELYVPPTIMFRSTIVPTEHKKRVTTFRDRVNFFYPSMKLRLFCWKYGFTSTDFYKFLFFEEEDLNIVSIFPDLQPQLHLVSESHKFVGCCLREDVRSPVSIDEKVQSILNLFEPVNPASPERLRTRSNNNSLKLIYVSFGTVVHDQEAAFIEIIEGGKSTTMAQSIAISESHKIYWL